MDNQVFVVATLKPWNVEVFDKVIKHYPGQWHLITEPKDLTADKIESLAPKYVFFPHWSDLVPSEILDITTCVCFHGTDVPYGRGGSPLQNLIARGHRETVISALKMTEELDAGPVFLKRQLSLEGLAEEIFIRMAHIVAEMIETIISENPEPTEQTGTPTLFERRTADQSEIGTDITGLAELFDHIRMLDAESYPRAFLESGGFRFEISRPALKAGEIIADVRITKTEGNGND